jgi:CheY-like chemotaxis protein
MARVLVLTPDLLFGSRVQAALQGAGHDVELVAGEERLRARLVGGGVDAESGDDELAASAADVLVVDLTDDALDGDTIVEALDAEGALGAIKTLGFYSHVDVAARERAERAGFDLLVPRSRMAREGTVLVSRLTS